MDPLVSLEMRHLTKGFSTLTLMWFFSFMCDLMSGEVGATPETLPTCSTLTWLFPSMDHLVCLETRHLTKGFSTLRTLMGLFSCVCSLMNCKSGRCSKGFETLGTFMLFLPCVRLLMSDDILSFFLCTPFARMDPLNVSYNIIRHFHK